MSQHYDIRGFFDGASRGNPGPSGAGYYIEMGDKKKEGCKNLGQATNNQAEYHSIILLLEYLVKQKVQNKNILVQGDSNLIINHLNKQWKVNKNVELFNKASTLLDQLRKNGNTITLKHIKRNLNGKADALANKAIDSTC